MFGHAFEAFKLMVQDDGAAVVTRLEEERGPLTVYTPAVSINQDSKNSCPQKTQMQPGSEYQPSAVGKRWQVAAHSNVCQATAYLSHNF